MLNEHKKIIELTSKFSKPEYQLNDTFTSDAEILTLGQKIYLAITTDSIVEEISTGLYADPYLMGWMIVVVNLSDLAAVGAEPLGLLLVQNFPESFSNDATKLFLNGVEDACKKHNTHILGGDTNTSKEIQLSGTAIGKITGEKIISRIGANIGDIVFVSSALGNGGLFAFKHFFHKEDANPYLPEARISEGLLVHQFGSICIDTSDGFIPAIATLMTLNDCGFVINKNVEDFLNSGSLDLSKEENLPPWIFLAGPHGEFELLFTIPKSSEILFKKEALKLNWNPLEIGYVQQENEFEMRLDGTLKKIDPFLIANLFDESQNKPVLYLKNLIRLNQSWE